MTNRVRKGNDVRIRWRVDRLGEPVNLEEASIKVELVDRFRRSVPVTFSAEGNVVIIDFAAANQKTNGVHTAVLIISDGYTTNTVDKCNIIDLVEHSCEESCLDVDAEGMVWIDVASNLAFPANGKDGIGIDSIVQTVTAEDSEGVNKIEITLSNGEKVRFEVRNGRRGAPGYTPRKGVDYSDGKSLYELLVDAGLFEGTLDDFLARFENARTVNETATKRANEAAQSANDAADRANSAAEAVEPYENRLENVEGKVTELAKLESDHLDYFLSPNSVKRKVMKITSGVGAYIDTSSYEYIDVVVTYKNERLTPDVTVSNTFAIISWDGITPTSNEPVSLIVLYMEHETQLIGDDAYLMLGNVLMDVTAPVVKEPFSLLGDNQGNIIMADSILLTL